MFCRFLILNEYIQLRTDFIARDGHPAVLYHAGMQTADLVKMSSAVSLITQLVTCCALNAESAGFDVN